MSSAQCHPVVLGSKFKGPTSMPKNLNVLGKGGQVAMSKTFK